MPFEISFKFEFVFTLPDLEIAEEEKKEEESEQTLDLKKFKHYDGNVKIKSFSGGFIL